MSPLELLVGQWSVERLCEAAGIAVDELVARALEQPRPRRRAARRRARREPPGIHTGSDVPLRIAVELEQAGLVADAGEAAELLASMPELDEVTPPPCDPPHEPAPMPVKVRKVQAKRVTKAIGRVSRTDEAIARLLYPLPVVQRPRTRGECVDGPRPCPWVGCRHHTYLEVNGYGTITIREGNREPWEVDPATSCSLDVADRGPLTLEQIGEVLHVTRERVRQLEDSASASLRQREAEQLADMRDTAAELVAARDARISWLGD